MDQRIKGSRGWLGVGVLALLFSSASAACSCQASKPRGIYPDGGTGSGSNGSNGSNGTHGSTGSNGSNGTSGNTGTTGFDAGPSGTLLFQPNSATLVVTASGTQTTNFTLEYTPPNGTSIHVAPQSLDFDHPDLATVTSGDPVVATAPSSFGLFGGVGVIHAIYNGVEARATLTVQVQASEYGSGVDPNSAAVTALNGSNLPSDPASNIDPLLYPYDQTVWPLGLTSPPVMWNAPQAGDVYRMHYAESDYTFDGYYTLSQLPGSLRLSQDAWDRITASNQSATGADPLTFELLRYDSVAQKAYATSTQTWTIAPASLRGSIYYWTTSNGGSLSRIPPGAGAVPQPLAGPNGNNCMGCHAVSADGTTLVAGVRGETASDSSDDRAWTSFNLPAGTVRKVSNLFSGNLAITPDGKYVVSGDETLKLSDSSTAEVVNNSGLADLILDPRMTGLATPAFSPNGQLLAAIEEGGSSDWQFWDYTITPNSELVTLSFDETTPKFSPTATKLADSTQFPSGEQTLNYPSFSPDSKWVAFQVADHNSGCWSYPAGCANTTTESGAIYLTSTTPATPIRLTKLSDPPLASEANLSLEPTFNPVERGGYFWIVFTSERTWGNDSHVQGVADNDKKRLWVSAIDPTIGTVDPSHPAFFLEGQDETTQNMRGFWTLSQCIPTPGSSELGTTDGGACVNGFDCCSGFCEQGQCIGVNQVACAGLGESCNSVADCCNSASVDCVSNKCSIRFR